MTLLLSTQPIKVISHENEIFKEAVDFAKAKKWIARSPVLPGDEQ